MYLGYCKYTVCLSNRCWLKASSDGGKKLQSSHTLTTAIGVWISKEISLRPGLPVPIKVKQFSFVILSFLPFHFAIYAWKYSMFCASKITLLGGGKEKNQQIHLLWKVSPWTICWDTTVVIWRDYNYCTIYGKGFVRGLPKLNEVQLALLAHT